MDPPPIAFPFPYGNKPWKIQHDFMLNLYECIDAGSVGVFESPTGTGKSLSILCGALKWLHDKTSESLEARIASRVQEKISQLPHAIDDPNEPEWVRQMERSRIEREARFEVEDEVQARKQRMERLEVVRKMEKRRIAARPAKQMRCEAKPSKVEQDETDFLVQDYESEDEEAAARAKLLSELRDGDENAESDQETGEIEELKIFYCSRTHSQLSQFVSELKKTEYSETIKSLSLGSRKNLCINEDVLKLSSAPRMNDACLDLQKGKGTTSKCPYLPSEKKELRDFTDLVNASVKDIEELAHLGKSKRVCSYYGARNTIPGSQIVTLPYNMMLQKSTRESLGIKLKGNIVIFDEAHNIIDTITSTYSVTFEKHQIERAKFQLQSYFQKYSKRLKGKNIVYIKQILIILSALQSQLFETAQMKKAKGSEESKKAADGESHFKSPSDFVNELRVDHINLFKICNYLEQSKLALKVQGFTEKGSTSAAVSTDGDIFVAKHIPALQQFHLFIQALMNVSLQGRVGIILAENDSNSCFKYLLLSPTDVFQEIVSEARSVILAGGTMEPMAEFKSQLLGFLPQENVRMFSCGHIVPATSILTMALPVGASGQPITFTYETRMKDNVIHDLGNTVSALCAVIPHGVVCFFVSYSYMDHVAAKWKASGVLAKIEARKKVFFEPRQARSVESCLNEYSTAIADPNKGVEGGRKTGAILFCVVGGKMSEGINFSDNMARGVVMVGLPYPSKGSPELIEKMRYVDSHVNGITSSEYYENLCMRSLNQSIGRAIRHKDDYAAIYLIDKRFSNNRIREKLPGWIRSASIQDVESLGGAISKTAQFFRNKRISETTSIA
ncbi:DEAD H (Asp-Glu-Ala-Asp His) box helicase 11 [Chytriomyces hyalinus]|nr:DEAD H (Asp-Glu-Ala-Asp His) box helicase 11 [Chytriomyces hyalinus]